MEMVEGFANLRVLKAWICHITVLVVFKLNHVSASLPLLRIILCKVCLVSSSTISWSKGSRLLRGGWCLERLVRDYLTGSRVETSAHFLVPGSKNTA